MPLTSFSVFHDDVECASVYEGIPVADDVHVSAAAERFHLRQRLGSQLLGQTGHVHLLDDVMFGRFAVRNEPHGTERPRPDHTQLVVLVSHLIASNDLLVAEDVARLLY